MTKTFSGITDASLIPSSFSISLTGAGTQTLSKADATQGADTSGNITLTWKITGVATSGTYNWSETDADKVDGYKLTSGTTGSKTLAAADITFPSKNNITEINKNSSKSFTFGTNTIFAALLTDNNVIVVTSKSMNASQRKAVETSLLPNMPQGNWTNGTVSYYTTSQLSGNGITINGGKLSYSSGTISFSATNMWSHAAYAEMSGAGLTAADISVTNTYQKSDVPLTGIFHANDAHTILFTLLALGAVAGVGAWLRRRRRLW